MADPNQNADCVRRFFDAGFNHGDIKAADYLAADYIDHSPIPAPAPGPAGFAMRMQGLRSAFVDTASFGTFLAQDDMVAFTWEFTGVHRGPFAGVAATGRPVTLAGINVERLERGFIVEHWSQFDLAGLVRQLTA